MKKAARIALITILFAALTAVCAFLYACGPDPNKCEHEWDNWKPLKEGHYHVCKKCKEKSKTYVHSFENYILTDDGYEHTCKLCGYSEQAPNEITVGNTTENKRLYDEMNAELGNFGKLLEKSNYLSYLMKMTYENDEVTMSVKATESPLYLEVSYSSDGNKAYPSVVREENGKIFSYVNTEYNRYKKSCLGEKENYEQPSDQMPDFSFTNNLALKTELCNITHIDDTYTIQAYYKDLIDDSVKGQLDDILSQFGLDVNVLYNSVTTITITVNSTSVSISIEIAVNVGSYDYPYPIYIKTTQIADTSMFSQVDFTKEGYHVLNATSIDEVYDLTDISKPITCDNWSNVFKVELTQGQYVIKSDQDALVEIVSAEDTENNIPLSIGDEYSVYIDKPYRNCFTVNKSGQYYVTFFNGSNDTYEFVRCEYDDVFDLSKPRKLTETISGRIEGQYDLEYYTYEGNKERLLTLTNTSNVNIEIICKIYENDFFTQNELKPNETIYVYVGEGPNKLFVCRSNATQPIDYSITTSFYDNDNGASQVFDEMPILTDTFSDEYYMTGYGFADKFMRLHAETKGQYLFEADGMWDDKYDYLQTVIYDKEMNRIDTVDDELDAGEYIVKLTNNDHILGITKIKYVFKSTADYEKDVKLPTVSYERRLYPSSYLPCENVTRQQVIKYKFTLNDAQTVMYDVEHIKIFDENGALVSPTYYNSFYNSFDVLKLDAGSYYFTTNQMSSTSDACLQIAITKDFTGDTVIDYDDMQILDVSYGVSLKKDSMYDKDYFAVNITDQGKYLFSNSRIELFDSQLNRINSRYDDNHTYYELAAGTYYVIIAHDYTSEIGKYLTVRLEKYEA